MTGSNRRHPPCKGGALPAELIARPRLHFAAAAGSLRRPAGGRCKGLASAAQGRFCGGPDYFESANLDRQYCAAYTSDIRNVAQARQGIAEFAAECGFSSEEISDIRLAAGEAFSNAVEHGRGRPGRKVIVRCTSTARSFQDRNPRPSGAIFRAVRSTYSSSRTIAGTRLRHIFNASINGRSLVCA